MERQDGNHAQSDVMEARLNPLNTEAIKKEFAAVGWANLIPFKNWFTDRPWTLLWVQFMGFTFGFPFLLINYYSNSESTLVESAWVFGIYFSFIWAVLIHRCVRPGSGGFRHSVPTGLFTSLLRVMIVIAVSVLGSIAPVTRDVFQASQSANIFKRLIGITLAVGVVEESAKLLPVLWYAHKCKSQLRPTTVAYIGIISGLAFGATEAIMYSVEYATGLQSAQIGLGDYLIVQILRLICLPFLHAIWTGISAYFVGLAFQTASINRAVILVGLCGVALLHGLYDTFANGWMGFFIAIASFAVFIGYIRDESSTINAMTLNLGRTSLESSGSTE